MRMIKCDKCGKVSENGVELEIPVGSQIPTENIPSVDPAITNRRQLCHPCFCGLVDLLRPYWKDNKG